MAEQKKLSEDDLKRVEQYLNSPVHQVERKAFRPLALLGGWFVIVSMLSLVSLWYAWHKGVLPLPAALSALLN